MKQRWLLPGMALALAAGILIGRVSSGWVLAAAGLLCGIIAVALLRDRGRRAALLTVALTAGAVLGWCADHPTLPPLGDHLIVGIVDDTLRVRETGQVQTTLCDVTVDGVSAGEAYWSFYGAVPEGLTPGCRVTMTSTVYAPSTADNPGGFDFRDYLLGRGITYGLYGAEDVTCASAGFHIRGTAASLRQTLTDRLKGIMGKSAGGYAATMLLSARDMIPQDERQAFSRLGVAHILTVSGFHVGVLAWLLDRLLRLIRHQQVRRWVRPAVLTVVLAAYCLLTGGGASALRATGMVLVMAWGRAFHRHTGGTQLLSAAVIVMLVLRPAQLLTASFQLTCGALLGLTLVRPYLLGLAKPKGRVQSDLWNAAVTTTAAQLGLLLPMLYWFHELPLLSLAVNLLFIPWASAVLVVCWAALALAFVPGVSAVIGTAAGAVMGWTVDAATALGSLEWISLWTKQANLLTAAGCLLMAGAVCCLWQPRKRIRLATLAVGVLVTAVSLVPWPSAEVSYVQLSVGSADAAVLRSGGAVWTVDTGEDGDALATYLHQRRLSVDTLILTHLHRDHASGLSALMDAGIPVGTCIIASGAADAAVDPSMTALLGELTARGTILRTVSRGDVLPFGDTAMTVLWPEKDHVRPGQDANESSMTLLWQTAGGTMLLTGDLDGRYEQYAAVAADVLKVAHHGSKSSTLAAFVQAVQPRAALLSCGDATREESIRERLDGVPVFATRTDGAVTVRWDDTGFTVSPYRTQ